MSFFAKVVCVAVGFLFFTGCGSNAIKARREQREKAMQSSKFYCEFLNGEEFPDIDVALNISMAQKCDSEKPFTVNAYKTPSEISGLMYCCTMHAKTTPSAVTAATAATAKPSKSEVKAESKSEPKIESKTDPKGDKSSNELDP